MKTKGETCSSCPNETATEGVLGELSQCRRQRTDDRDSGGKTDAMHPPKGSEREEVEQTYLSCADTKMPICDSKAEEIVLNGRVGFAGWTAFRISGNYQGDMGSKQERTKFSASDSRG